MHFLKSRIKLGSRKGRGLYIGTKRNEQIQNAYPSQITIIFENIFEGFKHTCTYIYTALNII